MQVLLSWFSLLLACKKASYQRKSFRLRLYPILVTVLVFAFTGVNFGERSQVKEYRRLASELKATCDGRAESDAGFSERQLSLMQGVTVRLHYDRSQYVFNFEEDFPFVKFDSRTMESWASISAAVSCVRKVGGPQHTKIELRRSFVRMKFSKCTFSNRFSASLYLVLLFSYGVYLGGENVMDTVVNAHAYGLPASTPSHARMRTLFFLPPAFHKKASQTE